MNNHNEEKRQLIHIALFLLAFSFKFLTKWQAAGLLFVLLVAVVLVAPRLKAKKYFYRQTEDHYSNGAVLYFLVLFVLVFIFPLNVVAAAWAILALGDGAATLIGKNLKVRELPWNREKSYIGTISFIFFGTLGAWIMLHWMSLGTATPSGITLVPPGYLGVSFKAALVAGIAESLHMRINDNITVAVVSAVTLAFLL